MLEQTLTKGEQVLVKKGRSEQVLALRHEYQEAMREGSSAKIAELTGRRVVAFLSANHVDPDLAAEIYVLDIPPSSEADFSEPPTLGIARAAAYDQARLRDDPSEATTSR
jgi:hypothetical protein